VIEKNFFEHSPRVFLRSLHSFLFLSERAVRACFTHLEKFSRRIVVEQKFLSIRLVSAVVYVLVKVPFESQKSLSNETRLVRVEFDAFDQNAGR
jgi:hypothetical protein